VKYLEDSDAWVPMALDNSHELRGGIATRLLAEAGITARFCRLIRFQLPLI
jgi:hypothetical protein